MSLFGFTDKVRKDPMSRRILDNSDYLLITGVTAALAVLSLIYIFPNDLFTSALFFDGLKLQQVFVQPARLFTAGIWAGLPDLSTEAFAFAAFLALIQIYMGYRASISSGSFVSGLIEFPAGIVRLVQRDKRAFRVDMEKFVYTMIYVGIALFDTWTDTEYRSFYGGDIRLYLKALAVSFLFYNWASEWALVYCSKVAINYGALFLNGLKPGSSRQDRNHSGGNQQRPQPTQQQQSKKNRGGGNNNRNPQQQQNSRPQMPQSHMPQFDPRAAGGRRPPIEMPPITGITDNDFE